MTNLDKLFFFQCEISILATYLYSDIQIKIFFNGCSSDAALTMLKKEFLGRQGSQMSDDEPLYDSVASDDDYAAITDNATTANEVGNISLIF